MIKLLHGDCLELMKDIPDNSVDMVLTDPPYGTTACKWDTVIPSDPMWNELKRITKDNGAICLFGSEPFSSHLRLSNLKMFKYDWIWEKNQASNFASAKKQPLKQHETVSVFYKRNRYYPQKELRLESSRKRLSSAITPHNKPREIYGGLVDSGEKRYYDKDYKNPSSVQKFKVVPRHKGTLHPTQKPVALLEYLIKTYTLENETVLDFTMGSGSTGVACKNLNRKFIGIEKDDKYFEIAKDRVNNA